MGLILVPRITWVHLLVASARVRRLPFPWRSVPPPPPWRAWRHQTTFLRGITTQDAAAGDRITPMLSQYFLLKDQHPGYLLMMRLGDFYECFFEDAIRAAQALDITLTKRGRHKGVDIPMCGIPHHALDTYLHRLVKKGILVAVCEQTEDPADARKRGSKTVRREVQRLVTPGTLTEDKFLNPRQHNFMASLVPGTAPSVGLAWLDLSTGAFFLAPTSHDALSGDLTRVSPSEILVRSGCEQLPFLQDYHITVQQHMEEWNGPSDALLQLCQRKGNEHVRSFTRAELEAGDALLHYIEETQKGKLPHLEPPVRFTADTVMSIDPATRKNLELTRTLSGDRKDSLLSVLDETITSAGARLLFSRISSPLTSVDRINERLDVVELFFRSEELLEGVRSILRKCHDMERCLARVTLGRCGPRDLAAIAATLEQAEIMRDTLGDAPIPYIRMLGNHEAIVHELRSALASDLPLGIQDGGFIARGYSEELDTLHILHNDGRRLIHDLEQKYRTQTGALSLKIRQNNIIGFFVEVSPGQREKITEEFALCQQMVTAMRYKTVELTELEGKIMRAANEALVLEIKIFEELCQMVKTYAANISDAARALSILDVSTGLAKLARMRNFTRPMVTDGDEFIVEGGRHAVVEAIQEKRSDGVSFVRNDCYLTGKERLWLVTGPNMGGKSTFLRQNAIIVIMAQMGSYVPADLCRIGVVDCLFSRVGASDDLAHCRSTFMVEMVETAAILKYSTRRSLVILDEIGRGTATYDGLSIAWAVLESLFYRTMCRTLFATHFTELAALKTTLGTIGCYTMKVEERDGNIIFAYRVVPGVADKAYGVHVASLAGVPEHVTSRATTVLAALEERDPGSRKELLDQQSPPGMDPSQRVRDPDLSTPKSREVVEAIREVEADSLSPRAALDLVYMWKDRLTRA